jgi:tetratricopeptide (TPR) repeat protein
MIDLETSIGSQNSTGLSWRRLALGALLFGSTCLVYLPALRCGFIWDDDAYLVDNRSVQTWDGLTKIWFDRRANHQYYPLVYSTFWVEYRLWGLSPGGYHFVNVAIHAATTVLLWRLLVALDVPGAWLAAALFGVHPVHVESVAWITERKNVLSGLCYVLALRLVLPLFGLFREPYSRRFLIKRYLIASLVFAGALLSKSVACTLPAACLLIIYWKRGRITWRDVGLMFPWFILGAAAGFQTAWLERINVGAKGAAFSWTPLERCWIAGNALWFYLGKLLWPHPLIFSYPRWSIDVHHWTGWIAPTGAALLPVGLWVARGRIGRGPLVATLFFGGTLLPALGFVSVYPMRYSFVADHFQYLASLGPIVLCVGGATTIMSRWTGRMLWSSLGWVAVLLLMGAITWHQQASYRDAESLWSDVVAKNPASFLAHIHLGKIRAAQGRYPEATDHFRAAVALEADDSESHIDFRNLGMILARQGKFVEARECFTEAVRRDPDDWAAIHELAILAGRQHRHKEAAGLFRRALLIRPDEPIVHVNLGNALAADGGLDAAIVEYLKALALRPELVEAKLALAKALARGGRLPEGERLNREGREQQPIVPAPGRTRATNAPGPISPIRLRDHLRLSLADSAE